MKILVTGGTGFLGKHIMPKLQTSGQDVWAPSSKELDLSDWEESYDAMLRFQPDTILHMAALCGGILANKNSPADFLHKNLDMASLIFHTAKLTGCKRVYTLGSVCAYPKFCLTPFNEDELWNGYPEETNAPYGIAKRVQMLLGQTYREQYGIGGAHLIPVNLYGEYDHFDPTNSHVIPALIRKFEEANRQGRGSVKLWGTGKATREFLYAGDAAEAIAKAVLTGFDSPQPINLGTGQDISIEDLAYLIEKLTNSRSLYIQFTGEVSDGQPKRMLDVSRAKELLGWTAQTSFEEGLRRTIDWYRSEGAS
jgi:GDP-L-fucose synthase